MLRVVYLVFNEAYLSATPAEPMRVDLADEAIRLGRQLAELMPDEPEVLGLLSLMLAQHARAGSPLRRRRRTGADGGSGPLAVGPGR